jgi:hypothetical protein
MIIQKYCSKRMTGNVISARTIVREKKLKRLAQKSYSVESKGKK